MIFRKANIDDYSGISRLKEEIHKMHRDAEPYFFKATDNILSLEYYEAELNRGGVFVLENEEELIGYMFIVIRDIVGNPVIKDQKILFINDLCILSNKRNKGYGKFMMDEISNYGKTQKVTSIELEVWKFNESAIDFYKNYGMRESRIKMRMEI